MTRPDGVHDEGGLREAARREGSFGQTLKAVAGVIGAVLFVLALVLLIRWVISSGVAQ